MRSRALGVGVLSLFLFGGCTTMMPPKPSGVSFQSTPPGAQVFVNGTPQGRTPFTMELACEEKQAVVFTLDGYQSFEGSVPKVPGLDHWGTVMWPVDRCAPVVYAVLAPLSVQR